MKGILSDLLSGKMNVRKWILWGFAVAFLTVALVVAIAAGRAAVLVSNYIADNPEIVRETLK